MYNIIFIAFFILPGYLTKYYFTRFFGKSYDKYTDTEIVIALIIYSIPAYVLNMLAIKHWIFPESTYMEFENVSFKFLTAYTLLSIISGMIVAIGLYLCSRYIAGSIKNLYRGWKGKSKESYSPTIWEKVFEINEVEQKYQYVSIERNGIPITRGQLVMYTPCNSEKNEFLIKNSDYMNNMIDRYEHGIISKEQCLFTEIDKEYFDIDSGLLIKFYKIDKYKEACEKQ